MKILKSKSLKLSFLLILLLFLCSCGVKQKLKASDEEYYGAGLAMLEKGSWHRDNAQKIFDTLVEQYPSSRYVPLSHLVMGDSYYTSHSWTKAKTEYESYLTLYPKHQQSCLARYRLGVSYFQLKPNPERSQEYTSKSLDAFLTVQKECSDLEINPVDKDSEAKIDEYAHPVDELIQQCRNSLAEHEFNIGYFYFKRKTYKAVIKRFEDLLAHYPEANILDKVHYYLARSYQKQGEKETAAKHYQEILDNYPDSKYFKKSKEKYKQMD